MNSFFKSVILWGAVICAIPAAAAGVMSIRDREKISPEQELILPEEDRLTLLCTSTGEISPVSAEEYAVFAVLGEVPFIPDEEALKAQVCAARTYAARRILAGTDENGANISDDSSKYQTALSEADARAVYGDEYEAAYSKVKAAADSTRGEIIMYGGAPAAALFHISSAGCTESAEELWGTAYPYLVSVSSDCTVTEREFTAAEISARISAEYENAEDFKGIAILSRTKAGTVLSLRLCGIEMSGERLAELLSLESAAFQVSERDGGVSLTVKGSGHLAGMSISGADELSRRGYSYREILEHYYPGTEIEKMG